MRDLLLGVKPKDFDIATDATPEQVKKLFRRAFIIGRRFQIVHVMFGQETIEVSTFRAYLDSAAAEQCPVFFGGTGGPPPKVHWGYPDPSNAEGGDEGKRRAFELTRQAMGYRMIQLLQLPLEAMNKFELERALADIARR